MQILKSLFSNFISFFATGLSAPEEEITCTDGNEDAESPFLSRQFELPEQTDRKPTELAVNSVCLVSEDEVENQHMAGLVLASAERLIPTQPVNAVEMGHFSLMPELVSGNVRHTQASVNASIAQYIRQNSIALTQPRPSNAILDKSPEPDPCEDADKLYNIGLIKVQEGLYSKAESLFEHTLAIREQRLGFDHPSVADSLVKLAAVFASTGRYDQAERYYSRALSIYEKSIDANRPIWDAARESLVLLQRFHGHRLH